MKVIAILMTLVLVFGSLCGCVTLESGPDVAATTLPVYEFTTLLCQNTAITVGRLVTENVSCLHDYSLQVSQMRMIESANVIVISGAGLESFLEDALDSADTIIDASIDTHVHSAELHQAHEDHDHESDPHIWLSPENAKVMAQNICVGLAENYPEYADTFAANLDNLLTKLDALQAYGDEALSPLSCRELVTFHDGFAYFAESFDLEILRAVEEESGSEAAASELKELILLVEAHALPAIFTETNGSVSAADVISAETGAAVYTLSMAMSGDSYFAAMYHNIDTIKEALE